MDSIEKLIESINLDSFKYPFSLPSEIRIKINQYLLGDAVTSDNIMAVVDLDNYVTDVYTGICIASRIDMDYVPSQWVDVSDPEDEDLILASVDQRYNYFNFICWLKAAIAIELLRRIPMVQAGARTTEERVLDYFPDEDSTQEAYYWIFGIIVLCYIQMFWSFRHEIWWLLCVWFNAAYCYILCKIKSLFSLIGWYFSFLVRPFTWFYWWHKNTNLKVVDQPRYLPGQLISIINEAGHTYYKMVAGGQEYICSTDGAPQLEMAMPNSLLSNSVKRPVGVIVTEIDGKPLIVGGFFRINDYLVTALHVAEQIMSRTVDFKYVGFDHKPNKSTLDMSKSIDVNKDDYSLENNAIKTTVPDVYAMKMDSRFWSIIGITASSFAMSHYHQTVTTAGVRDAVLVAATGKTHANATDWMLDHTATTYSGFSGFPVYCGSRVVGMHVSGTPKANQMVRIEVILQLLPKPESPMYVHDVLVHGPRMNGKLCEEIVLLGHKAVRDRDGHVYWYEEDVRTDIPFEDAEDYITDIPSRDLYGHYKHRRMETGLDTYDHKLARESDIQDFTLNASASPVRIIDTESASLKDKDTLKSRKKKTRQIKKKKPLENSPAYTLVGTGGTCAVPRVPEINTESVSYLMENKDMLNVLGYDETAYQWPSISKPSEEISLRKHLELYHKRVMATDPEKLKMNPEVVSILCDKLKDCRFEVDPNYKSRDNLISIINSSAIKDSKSPGYPYCANGQTSNAQVIKDLGVEGLVKVVLDDWDSPLLCRVFLKSEPHKKKKIESGMLRIIAGFPLHKTIKHIAIFQSINKLLVEKWSDVPVKFAYSPLVPGSNKHLRDVFKSKTVWESDKTNWDFNMFDKYFKYFAEFVVNMAVKPVNMSQRSFEEYLRDVREAVDEVSKAQYVLSNGNIYKSTFPGIQKSGWFNTITSNSISQLAVDIETQLECGISRREIVEHVIIVGGDDVMQEKLKILKEEYEQASRLVGVPMSITETPFEGSEYFSHRFKIIGSSVAAVPTRFTKHIENLKRANKGEIGSSLVSLMHEWVWDDDKYKFFHDMYMYLRSTSSDSEFYYPLKVLPFKDSLRRHIDGLEDGWADQNVQQLHRTVLERWQTSIQC